MGVVWEGPIIIYGLYMGYIWVIYGLYGFGCPYKFHQHHPGNLPQLWKLDEDGSSRFDDLPTRRGDVP